MRLLIFSGGEIDRRQARLRSRLKIVRPGFFAKPGFVPEVFKQFDLRLAFFSENDADDIVTVSDILQTENFAIHSRRPDDLSLFSQINGGNRRGELVGRARFDFDETQNIGFIERDNINLARHLRADRISADRNFEIGDNETASVFHQKTTR